MTTSMSIRLPDKVASALATLARTTDRTKSYLILKALDAFLAEYADYQVAIDRLRDKDDPVISASELRKHLASPR